MDSKFQKLYGVSGLFLVVLALLNLFTDVGQLKHIYVFTCIGLFLFFDSLNYFIADQEPLLAKKISPLQGAMFVLFSGAVLGFISEIYGAAVTGVWQGAFTLPETFLSVQAINFAFETIFVYGLLIMPGYAIFRILKRVFEAETMLKKEFGSDYYRYFVHTGLLMMAAPFLLLVVDAGSLTSYLMFIGSLVGLLFVIEYFEFRKKGQGIIANISYRERDKLGAVLTLSVLAGFVTSFITQQIGFWTSVNVPLSGFRCLGTPVTMIFAWTMLIWVVTSGFNLISDVDLSNLDPEESV
ncbi:MAG: hypothetical protein ACLFTA_01705 [Candidatus Nanohaloarchaea archaeon]